MPEEKEKEVKGWKDVNLDASIPLGVFVNFLNVLNQRLCSVEDIVTVKGPDGKMISLTDLYEIETKEQMEQMQKKTEEKEGA